MADEKNTRSGEPRRSSAEQAKAFTRSMMDSMQQIYLAGLGAFSKAQHGGGALFETLVEEGARTQEKIRAGAQTQFEQAKAQFEQAQRKAGPWFDDAKRRTGEAFGKFEQAFDERIARATQRMQMPTRDDIAQLNERLDELAREVRAGKPAPRKRAAKKTPRG
ncbi:MAG: phasin family protein [Proteobacteria bacterium]|nr:phasin family protein [Pseudomonadota bacterium]